MKSREEISAGGVVYRQTPNGIEVLICRRWRTSQKWVIPKGLIDPGEQVQQTAAKCVKRSASMRGSSCHLILPSIMSLRGKIRA